MNKLFFLVLFSSLLGLSQSRTIELSDFNNLKLFDRINLVLVPSNENKLIIEGTNANEVNVLERGNELRIRLPLTQLLQGDNIEAVLYYKELTIIEANEGSVIQSSKPWVGNNLKINAKEGSQIELTLEAKTLDTKLGSGAKVEIKGNANLHQAIINSGAVLEARDFKTKKTEITCNAGGEADVFASEKVVAKTRAGGDIVIFGNPDNIDRKTVLGGSIKLIEEIKR